MSEAAELSPEPWPVHLLGLITPLIVIASNILGVEEPMYVAAGVVFVWGIGPILDIVMASPKSPVPPENPVRPSRPFSGRTEYCTCSSWARSSGSPITRA